MNTAKLRQAEGKSPFAEAVLTIKKCRAYPTFFAFMFILFPGPVLHHII